MKVVLAFIFAVAIFVAETNAFAPLATRCVIDGHFTTASSATASFPAFAPQRQLQQRLQSTSETSSETTTTTNLVGDDSDYFSLQEQKRKDWINFSVATGTVLAIVAWAWVLLFGPHGGDLFLETVQSMIGTTDRAATVAAMLTVFAVCHSGIAALRTYTELIVGAWSWRVIFAIVSLPLALSCISYFVNHAHDGVQLWDVTGVPGMHTALWITNFVSFLFLYPSMFNLLEVAAIEKPQLHLWEPGIIRITRHPQAVGQCLWCAGHPLWLGTSPAVAACTILVLHHLYSTWHGGRRLKTWGSL